MADEGPDPEPAAPDAADGAGGPEGPAPGGPEPDPEPAAPDSADGDAEDPAPAARTSGPRKVVRPVQPVRTFVFHNGAAVHDTIAVKDGEALPQPENPASGDLVFTGWYADEACTQPFDGFGEGYEADGSTTHLYAGFKEHAYIFFHDPAGNVVLTESVAVGDSYTFSADHPAFPTAATTSRNEGWKGEDGTAYDGTVAVTGDLHVYPNLEKGNWVHFDTDGGSHVDKQFVHVGERAARPADPVKSGYTFAGWQLDGADYDFGAVVAGEVTLTASWTPSTATYTIAYWLEDINDDGYTFLYSKEKTGTVGERLVFAGKAGQEDALPAELLNDVNGNQVYFLEETRTTNSIAAAGAVAGDGTTVVDAYYRRFVSHVTVTLDGAELGTIDAKADEWIYEKIVEAFPGVEGKWLYRTWHSVTKQDGSVGDVTHTAGTVFGQNCSETTANFSSQIKTHPDGGAITYAFSSANSEDLRGQIQGFTEKLGSGGYTQFSDYEAEPLYIERVREGSSVTFSWRPAPEGYQLYGIAVNGELKEVSGSTFSLANNTALLYYNRVRNNIEFYNDNASSVDDITQVPYETPLSAYADAVSGYVAGETTYTGASGGAYVFEGWWDNPGFEGDPVSFEEGGTTMPAHGLRLYAKWEAPTFTVTYDPKGGAFDGGESGEFAGSDPVALTVPYKGEAPEPADPAKAGSAFVEWETLDGQPFHFDTAVTRDYTLVAYWSSASHRVLYAAGEGSGSADDPATYLAGSRAVVLDGSSFRCADGRHFVGWRAEGGAVYLPGELVPVGDADVVLTAVYDGPLYAGLSYDLNYSSYGVASPVGYQVDASSVPHVRNNTVVALRAPTTDEIPDGYTFAGWYLDAACSGEPLSEVMVDADAPLPNVVYAKWERAAAPQPGTDPDPQPDPADDPRPEPQPDPADDPRPEPAADPDPAAEPQPEPAADSEPGPQPDPAAAAPAAHPSAASPGTGDALPAAALAALALCSLCVAAACRPRAARPRPRHARR